MTADEIAYLEGVGSRMVRQRGHVFMREGEAGEFALLVKKGHVKVQVGKPARIVAFRGPGDTVGEMAVVTGSLRTATVVAWDDVEVLHISATVLKAFLHKFTRAMYALLVATDERVAQATRMVVDSDLQAERRIAKAFVALVEDGLTTRVDGVPTVRLSQQDIASLTGTSVVSVKKIIRVFKEHGLIDTGRYLLVVRDVAALKEIADGKPMESW